MVPVLTEWLAVSVMEMMGKIKEGQFLQSFFQPLRSLSGVLGILGVFKLEYALVHGMPEAEETNWLTVIWEFITSF